MTRLVIIQIIRLNLDRPLLDIPLLDCLLSDWEIEMTSNVFSSIWRIWILRPIEYIKLGCINEINENELDWSCSLPSKFVRTLEDCNFNIFIVDFV